MLEFESHTGGQPESLVLLHSLGLDRSLFDDFIPHLTPHFEVLAVDLPGHGASPLHDSMTIASMADEVGALLRKQGAESYVILGISLGGCVAQAVAVRHPDLVRGLGLIDTTSWYGENAAHVWEERAQKGMEVGIEALAHSQLERWFTPGFNDRHPEVGQRLVEVWNKTGIESFVATCRALGSMDLRDEITGIDVPTAILVGADDQATDITHAQAMHQRIPGATLHVIPEAAHLSAAERPETVTSVLEKDLFTRI
jgi:3-oxoadipate enol-lactonase